MPVISLSEEFSNENMYRYLNKKFDKKSKFEI